MVTITVELVSSFVLYHSRIYNENFAISDTSKVWVFDNILVLNTIQVNIPYQEPSYLSKIALVSIQTRIVFTQIINPIYKDLDITHQILTFDYVYNFKTRR